MHAPIIRNIAPAPVAAPEPPSILIGLAELARIVTIAKPFTSNKDFFIFGGIRFFARGGKLWAEATDRYAIVRVSSDVNAPDGLSVNLAATDCAQILARFRPRRGKSVKLRITIIDGLAVVKLAEGALAIGEDAYLTLRPLDGIYPDMDRLFAELAEGDPSCERVMLDPKNLAKLPEPAGMKTIGAMRPVGFYGDDWAALVQPMRAASADDPSKRWAA